MPASGYDSKRYFDTGDQATDHNLARLDHLAATEWYGAASHMHDWVCGIIGSLKLLPPAVSRHFQSGAYFIGGQHYSTDDAGRQELWRQLAAQLKNEIDAVLADPALKRDAAPDLSGRPITKGERIVAICDELQRALANGGDSDRLAAKLEYEGGGTEVASDARQLRKLFAKKRIPDSHRHQAEIHRLVYHARVVGRRLDHLE